MIDKTTIIEKKIAYAVFGNPIKHSLSPVIHAHFAEQTQQSMSYQKHSVPLDAFAEKVRAFFSQSGGGLNITVPFKVEAFQLANQLTKRAKAAGAVNTLWQEDGLLWGDNTDGCGLIKDITQNLGWEIQGKSVLILGAGGAVRGILQPLAERKPKQIVIANRTEAKALALAEAFADSEKTVQWQAGGFDQLEKLGAYDLIINGTSASLDGDLPPLTPQLLHADSQCYDMMYSAKPTVFLQWAAENGCTRLSDGLGMLVEQAAEAFNIWRGVQPETESVIQTQRRALLT